MSPTLNVPLLYQLKPEKSVHFKRDAVLRDPFPDSCIKIIFLPNSITLFLFSSPFGFPK